MSALQEWDVWYPKAGATGLPFARGRCDATDVMLLHAAPPVLTVTVYDSDRQVRAQAQDLPASADTPITRLRMVGGSVERADIWPTDADLGTPVLLPGGEIGILKAWWHAADHSEWRWQIELYNHR